MSARPRRGLALGWAALFTLSLLVQYAAAPALAQAQESSARAGASADFAVPIGCGYVPLDIELIIDKSGSMVSNSSGSPAHTRLYWAQLAAKQLVDNLQANGGISATGHRVGITTFSGTTSTADATAWTSDATTLKAKIDAITSTGSTPLKLGMSTGAADLAAHARNAVGGAVPRIIILLSDGRPNPDQGPNGLPATTTTGQRPTQAQIDSFRASADQVFSIAIGQGGSGSSQVDLALMQLLQKPSGHYYNVVDASLLPSLFATIFQQISCPAHIVVSKTVDHATASPGGVLHYSITITNDGQGDATGVSFSDNLTAVLSHATFGNDAAASSGASPAYNAGTKVLSWSGNIAAGASVTITFSITLAAVFGAPSTALTNVAVVQGTGSNCPDPATALQTAACTATTTVSAAPNLVVEKHVNTSQANPGDALTYTITAQNTGSLDTSTSITDDLTALLSYIVAPTLGNLACSPACTLVGNVVHWDSVSVPAKAAAQSFVFHVTIKTVLPSASNSLVNTASATGSNCPAGQGCTTTTFVPAASNLGITKDVEPTTIAGGSSSPVSYTIVVSNTGTAGTSGHVLVTDNDFPAFYSIIGVVCAPTNATCDAAHLTGGGIDLGALAASSSVTITVSGTAAPDNTSDLGDHANTADACEQVVEGQSICVHDGAALAVTLTDAPAIHVMKSSSASFLPYPGGEVTYTYVVTNTGNVALSGVWVDDDICGAAGFVSGDGNGNSLLDLDETWTFDCTDSLDRTTTNVATAYGSDGDNTVSDTDTKTVTVGSQLLIDKGYAGNSGGTTIGGAPLAKVGDTLTFILTYDLSGPPVHDGVIVDTLPLGIAYVDGTASSNAEFTFVAYDATLRTLTWQAPLVSADGSLTYQVTVLDTAPVVGSIVNSATIDSEETALDLADSSVLVQGVQQATGAPPPTVPPTDSFQANPQDPTSAPGFALLLVLLALAGLMLAVGSTTSVRHRVSRRAEDRRR